jgi:hypothetical protein
MSLQRGAPLSMLVLEELNFNYWVELLHTYLLYVYMF